MEEVFAPESTRALIAGIPSDGNEHHSSLPTISLSVFIKKGLLQDWIYKKNLRWRANSHCGTRLTYKPTTQLAITPLRNGFQPFHTPAIFDFIKFLVSTTLGGSSQFPASKISIIFTISVISSLEPLCRIRAISLSYLALTSLSW